ncbi:hypothetical protein [Bradyrhizobium neotropicale]|uniref:hypothetical protein n=1 Tax=Bradyrhizobium neotropicale TaxID=1497615 RepID=UPI001AD6DB30|nr:hypothetical protein [Bradyrhizobium neotropicale]MBO4227222.1 hypothetical protein [Bradyrhizobium neotropicale]
MNQHLLVSQLGGRKIDPLSNLLAEFQIRVVPIAQRLQQRETHAEQTMRRILEARGEEHLRLILMAIVETNENNSTMLVAPVLWAISDLLLAHPSWFGAGLLDTLDEIDLRQLYVGAQANKGAVPLRYGVGALLYERLRTKFQAVAS